MKRTLVLLHPQFVSECLTEPKQKKYYIFNCSNCNKHYRLRADGIKNVCVCKGCVTSLIAHSKVSIEKKCTQCKVLKPMVDFGIQSSKLDGHKSACKLCRSLDLNAKKVTAAYQASYAGKAISTAARVRRRTSMQASNNGSISAKSLEELMLSQENKCYYCSCILDTTITRSVHLDHIIPLIHGGTHTIQNVVWSCQYCNLSKGSTNKDT